MSQANQRRIVAETRQSIHVHYRECQTAQFSKYAWKCWEAQRIDIYTTVSSNFQIEGALTVNAFADNASVQIVTIYQMIVMCMLVGSDD